MPTTLVVVGDLHVGGEYALCPRHTALDGGGSYRPNKWQNWLRANWREFWERVGQRPGRKIYVFNGDTVQGQPFNDVQVWTVNRQTQEAAAMECIEEALEIAPADALYFIRGTASHVGKAGQSDERIARNFIRGSDAEKGPHSHFRLDIDIDGVRVMVKHHPSSRSVRVYTTGGAVNRCVAQLLTIAGKYRHPAPHLAIWGHAHVIEDTGATWPHCRGIIGPCWQLETEFGHRITDDQPDIGGVIVEIEDGAYDVEIVRYLLARRRAIKV